MKTALMLVVVLLIGSPVFAQQSATDSLLSVWRDESRPDSLRVKAYKEHIWNDHLFSDPDSAFILAEALHDYADKHDYPIAANQALTLQGIVYEMKGDFPMAMEYIQRSIAANEKIGNRWGISEALIVVGVLYEEQGNYPRALEHYNKALLIDEEIGNKEGMAMSLNNIGNIHHTQGNASRALEYYLRALAIDEELGIKQGIAVELSNVGQIYQNQGDTDKALEYFERGLELNEEIGDLYGIGTTLNSIGALRESQGDHALALEYYEKALATLEEVGIQQEVARSRSIIGLFHLGQDNEGLALKYCSEARTLAEEIGALDVQASACQCLYQAYKDIGKSAKALTYHERMIVLRDSIYNEENTKKLTRLEMQYEFDKKKAETRAAQEKKDAIAQQELKRQKLVRNGFMGGFAVVLLFAGVFFVQRNRIGKEKERSEELLLNILPEETAKELKEKGEAEARHINEVTVLFTDFKGFTAMSEKLSPKDLVKDLHLCFSLFDRICEKYSIEKIKTIGDAYMAAGGLPVPSATHAQDVVKAALEMAQVVEEGKAKKVAAGLPYFEIRIGIHTGPVVAGIVGIKKFQYDIWGDTVNTAARMESSGAVGKVNISEATYTLVKDQFACEHRGKVAAKGKGNIDMYFAEEV